MKRLIITLALFLFVHEGMTAQSTHFSSDGFAIVIYKYNATVNILGRAGTTAPWDVLVAGDLYRVFPTGPKVCVGDGRIPEGIYDASILPDGEDFRIEFRFETLPGIFEVFALTGPSLDYNAIPLHADILEDVVLAAGTMYAGGSRTIPIMILPGSLEPEAAERLEKARNGKPWQSLDAVRESCGRWRPVEEHFIRTGYFPKFRFEDGEIIILPEDPDPNSIAGGSL